MRYEVCPGRLRQWALGLLLALPLASVANEVLAGGSISGTVTLPGGAALSVEHMRLQRLESNGFWQHVGMTPQPVGSNGYVYTALTPNIYRVCYDDDVLLRHCFDGHNETASADMDFTAITLDSGQQRDNVNLAPQPGSEFRGRIRNRYEPAIPIESVALTLIDENGVAYEDRYDFVVDPNGNYVIGGVAPGRYYVHLSAYNFTPQFYPSDECVEDCMPGVYGELVTVPAGAPLLGVDFDLAPYSVIRMRVVESATGIDIPNPRVGGWNSIMGPALVRPARYDAASGEYVLYVGRLGEIVAAYSPGFVSRFVNGGHCYMMVDCLFMYPRLVLARDEVRHTTLRLVPQADYLFSGDFE